LLESKKLQGVVSVEGGVPHLTRRHDPEQAVIFDRVRRDWRNSPRRSGRGFAGVAHSWIPRFRARFTPAGQAYEAGGAVFAISLAIPRTSCWAA
jgi:hypothetical protein